MMQQLLSQRPEHYSPKITPDHSDIKQLSKGELKLLDLASKTADVKTHAERSKIIHELKFTRAELVHIITLVDQGAISIEDSLMKVINGQLKRCITQEEILRRIS